MEGIPRPAQNPYLVGHEEIKDFLIKMRNYSHLHHALLFEGDRGIGKATLAFHFSWQLLASRPVNSFDPIDENCAVWRQMALGCHPGLLHVSRPYDEKNGKFQTVIPVNEIRKINNFMHQTQGDKGWRIVIIDPADDMNHNAANALLKILEEPLRKSLFILISHQKGRLLPTIRSRCQDLHFKHLNHDHLRQILEIMATPIGFGKDARVDNEILAKSEGSVRKALLLLSHGGLEIASALDDFLAEQKFNLSAASQLVTVLSSREAQIQYDHFTDHLLTTISNHAQQCTLMGDLLGAEKLAQFYVQISDDIAQAKAYQLDKKHFILVLLTKIYKEFKKQDKNIL